MHSRLLLLAVCLASLVSADAQPPAPQPLSIDRIAAERDRQALQPRDFQWSPEGKTISFIETVSAAKARPRVPAKLEIWATSTADGKQSVLVSASDVISIFGREAPKLPGEEEENAVPPTQLTGHAWSPDGRALLLSTPVSLAWFDIATHAGRILVRGESSLSNPQVSPDGHLVAFIRDHRLWTVNITTGAVEAVSPIGTTDLRHGEPDWLYREELAMQSGYSWSPTSNAIAWIEFDDRAVDKYTLRKSDGDEKSIAFPKPGKAIPALRILVKPLNAPAAHTIDLGSDKNVYIPAMRWFPDGRHIAIERLSRDQKTLELLLADTTTGKSKVIITEKDDYWINLHGGLRILNDSRRFLWSSERSGFRHLYLYDTSGNQIAQLTKGEWEVTSIAGIDETAGKVYFTSTEPSVRERQLYSVNLDGSGLARITKQPGTHAATLSPDGKTFLHQFSDHATPTEFNLLRTEGTQLAAFDESRSEQAPRPSATTEYLTFATHLGVPLQASITKPSSFDPEKKYPVILFAAGGPNEQIVRDVWGSDVGLWLDAMAQRGYIILSIDNRGTSGRGHLFEEPVHLRFSSQELADLRDGVLYMHTMKWVDPARIGICGFGFGGYLSLHAMFAKSAFFKAGFAGEPISDWHFYDAFFTERYLKDPVRNQDGWLASSPLEFAENLKQPLLLAQATLDDKVHIENSLSVLDELVDARKYADILLIPDRQTLFEDRGSRTVLFQRLTDFFLKNL